MDEINSLQKFLNKERVFAIKRRREIRGNKINPLPFHTHSTDYWESRYYGLTQVLYKFWDVGDFQILHNFCLEELRKMEGINKNERSKIKGLCDGLRIASGYLASQVKLFWLFDL